MVPGPRIGRQRRPRLLSPRFIIACEGRKTEYFYFTRLAQSLKGKRKAALKVIRGSGGGAVAIVQSALAQRRQDQRDHKFSKRDGDEVYALIDVEPHDNAKADGLADALRIADLEDVRILLSNPSFEYWLLCHVAETNFACRSLADPKAVDRELKRLSGYDKDDFHRNPNLLDCLFAKVSYAVSLARYIHQKHHRNAADLRVINPCTAIYQLVERLI